MYLKYKQKLMIGITLIIVVCLIISGVFVAEFFGKQKEKVKEEPVEEEIDDRISPLENQGVVIEVLRLRHRGLYDKLTTMGGRDWKDKPTFYFVTNMDGLEFASNKVGQHGTFVEINFNTWDSMFMERKIVKDSEEEQETSDITLTIFEKVTTGIIFKKTKDVERDSITIEY
ncbi:MAG: hypothetical protein KAS76_06565, partial [Thermoplasmatales archaeon]|nr:hypothetical protein [Thermoplasmatales archaeon]